MPLDFSDAVELVDYGDYYAIYIGPMTEEWLIANNEVKVSLLILDVSTETQSFFEFDIVERSSIAEGSDDSRIDVIDEIKERFQNKDESTT